MGLNPAKGAFKSNNALCYLLRKTNLNLSGEAGFVLFLDLHALIFHDPWTNI